MSLPLKLYNIDAIYNNIMTVDLGKFHALSEPSNLTYYSSLHALRYMILHGQICFKKFPFV